MLNAANNLENLRVVFRLEGSLDHARLESSIQRVIEACPSLSHKFLRIGESIQIVVSPDQDGFSQVDGSTADESYAFGLIRSLSQRRFRMDSGAPYNFCLVKGRTVSYLTFVCHPALIDRYSLKPLFAAIARVYNGQPVPENLSLPQAELYQRESELLESPRYLESLRFWTKIARNSSFEWHPPRVENDLAENFFVEVLSHDLSQSILNLAHHLEMETEQLLLYSVHLFMARITRSETVMTAFSHRIRTGLPDQVGFNENTAAFKSIISDHFTIRHYLHEASRLFGQTRFHADIPADEFVREIKRIDPAFDRITNILVTDDHLPYHELAIDGVTATLLPTFSMRPEAEDIAIYFDVRDPITFHVVSRSPQEISGLRLVFDHYLAMLAHLPESLDKTVGEISLFTPELRARALALGEGGDLKAPVVDVMEQFRSVASRSSDAPAVRYQEKLLTYGELNTSARRVAAALLRRVDSSSAEARVGICLARGEKVIEIIFGAMTAGIAYVPMDPMMPPDRLSYIISDSKIAMVVVDETTRHLIETVGEVCALDADSLLNEDAATTLPAIPPERAAYLIYTSGTTGKPKGVVVERRQLAYLMSALAGVWERGPDSRWLQFAAVTFDASVLEIFNSLVHGGELVVAPSEARTDPEALFQMLKSARVTHAVLPPALLPLIPRQELPDFQVNVSGGDAVEEDAARFWAKTMELANCYGPTETTVMATLSRLGGYKPANHLGRPIPGYKVYLLEPGGALAPIGGLGEIAIGGGGVARGYWNRPELNAQRFVANPFGAGRLYRTGDLGRFLPSGDLEFLGRCDRQVKIRGFRIELGDVERALEDQREVVQAHVAVMEIGSEKTLVAWYTARNLTPAVLRERLSQLLPHYMVPSHLVPIASFPLTLNGKIDQARLPSPHHESGATGAKPMDDLQKDVCRIWAEALKLAPTAIDMDSHFFHLGGHSLLVAVVCNKLNAALKLSIRPKSLFEHPVFMDFCDHIKNHPGSQSPGAPLERTGALSAPVNSRLIGLIYSRAISLPNDNTYNVIARLDFTGLKADILARAVQELLSTHPIFSARFGDRNGDIWVESLDLGKIQIPIHSASTLEIDKRLDVLRAEVLGVKNAPLWRAEVFSQSDGASLVFCIHHAIFDGWSLNLLTEELAARIEALRKGENFQIQRTTWFDYCNWAKLLPQSEPFRAALSYWRKKLNGAKAHIDLPVERSQTQPNRNRSIEVKIDPALAEKLKSMADSFGITLSPMLFTIYLIWLWRLSNQEDLVCGYPYAGRDVPGSEEIYGTFVTMGFLRQRIRFTQTLRDLAIEVHRQMIEDKDHLVAAPYDAEIANMDALNVIFSLQTGIKMDGEVGELSFSAHEIPSLTSKGDISGVFYLEKDGGIAGRIEYDSSLFRSEAFERWVDVFRNLLDSATRGSQTPVGELSYLSAGETRRILDIATGPRLKESQQSVAEKFRVVAKANANKVALRFEGQSWTYAELDKWSDRIASSVGQVETSSRIGFCMAKSGLAVATILGLLKAGRTYVPLDPSYPAERLRFFAENCQLTCVVVDTTSRDALVKAGLNHLRFLTEDHLETSGEKLASTKTR